MFRYKLRRRKIGRYLWIVFSVLLIIYLMTLFETRVRPIINEVASSRAKSIATRAIAEVVNETMAASDITYSDLVIFQKNESENITAVTSNVVAINKLKATLTGEVEKRITDLEYMSARIPMGNFFGQSMFTGIGPRVTLRMIPVGYAGIDIKNDFSAAGINQTKHEIYLEVNCSISVLLPISSQSATVQTTIPIAETIIVGTVPDTYTHVTGQEDTNDAILNMLN